MIARKILFLSLVLAFLSSCQQEESSEIMTNSPSGNLRLSFSIESGKVVYKVLHKGEEVIKPSSFSFDFKDVPSFGKGLKVVDFHKDNFTESWEMPWGEQHWVDNTYNELLINLEDKKGRQLDVRFKVYDDGIGFRYEFPKWEGVDSLTILDENTEFNLTGDHTTWWIPGDWDIYEHLYSETSFTEIDATSKRNHPNLGQTYIPENAVNTPVTMKTSDGLYLSFHEANLTDYAGMTFKVNKRKLSMTSELVGSDRLGYKVKRAMPFNTPWRTLQVSEEAGGLIESNLIVNLNEPQKVVDISWFTPMKYVGIWWEMHVGVSSWDLASGKHGATTENTKRYIDFAAENGIGGVLVEGWNTGWERWIGFEDREGVFDFVTPYRDYNLKEVVQYGKDKGVEIIMHHETSAAPRTYDQKLDSAYSLMNELGIHTVKTGYVGKIIPKGEYHHGQWMVNHYRRVVEKGIEKQVAINAHEPIKDTGLRRTYPNIISREGLRGQEFNAWALDGGNPADHLPIVAFTRMLAGPIDFTPGVFDIKLSTQPEDDYPNQINTTLAQQLALYVVIYSPIQMACDLPQNYKGQPAFQFIKDVGVDWEQSRVLDGEVGDFVTIAREERGTGNWFVGSITNEEAREITINFDFLEEGKSYRATIYSDAEDTHWNDNPTAIEISEISLKKGDEKQFNLAPGGGLAISLIQTES